MRKTKLPENLDFSRDKIKLKLGLWTILVCWCLIAIPSSIAFLFTELSSWRELISKKQEIFDIILYGALLVHSVKQALHSKSQLSDKRRNNG